MTKDEAMQQALDALEVSTDWDINATGKQAQSIQAINALRTALAQPEKIECSRSHPHENMGSHCQLRTEIARLTNENAHLKAQPEPEPVAWMHKFIDDVITKNRPRDITRNAGRWTALYTVPLQRKPLSDEQIDAVTQAWAGHSLVSLDRLIMCREYARVIEAAHGIGEEK